MIKKVTHLPQIPCSGVIDLRVRSIYNAYGGTLAEIYCQFIGGEVTALMVTLGGGCTLAVTENAEPTEIGSFLRFLGVEVFCDEKVCQILNSAQFQTVNLLEFRGEATKLSEEVKMPIAKLFGLLKGGEDGDIVLPCFDEWYADFCVRCNHGNAEYFAVSNAVAVCGFKTEAAALITGVSVLKQSRGLGLGKAVLMGLVSKLKQQDSKIKIFATATDEKSGFYEKAGFIKNGRVAVLKI